MMKSGRDDEAVVDHLQDRPVGAVGAQGEDAGGDEAELGDRGVPGDQPHVGLGEGHHRAVEDRGQGDHQDHLLELDRRVGEERQHDPQEAVGADLGEHAGEDDQRPAAAPPGRRRASSRAARKAGILTRKAAAKNQKIQRWVPTSRPCCWIAAIEKVRWPPSAEMIAVAIAADQHQQRADQGVDDHLQRRRGGRRAALAVAAPGAEEEVERDQHQVEEEDEEQQVLGQERAQRRGLGQQHQEEEELRALLLAEGGEGDAADPEHRGQQDQEEVEAVDPEAVVDAEAGDPGRRRRCAAGRRCRCRSRRP